MPVFDLIKNLYLTNSEYLKATGDESGLVRKVKAAFQLRVVFIPTCTHEKV